MFPLARNQLNRQVASKSVAALALPSLLPLSVSFTTRGPLSSSSALSNSFSLPSFTSASFSSSSSSSSSSPSSSVDSTSNPVLDEGHVLKQMKARLPEKCGSQLAFYSSSLGGIIKDPALMTVPIDDHGFHRGHAVFDTCNVVDGRCYGLDMHLDRMELSAELSRIKMPSKRVLKEIVLDTIAAGGSPECSVRFWLTAGRGDFYITPAGCATDYSFYVMVHKAWHTETKLVTGHKEKLVSVPIKPRILATMKSTNYLLNALAAMEAEDDGGKLGIQVDGNYIAESAIACIGFVDKDSVFRTPPFEGILASTSLIVGLEFMPQLVEEGLLTGYSQEPVLIEDLKKDGAWLEAIQFGGASCEPVTHIDQVVMGDAQPGPVYKRLHQLMELDKRVNQDRLDDIPWEKYGVYSPQ